MNDESMTGRSAAEIKDAMLRLAGAVDRQECLMEEIQSRLTPILRPSIKLAVVGPNNVKEAASRSPLGRELSELAYRVDAINRGLRGLLEDCQL